MAKTSEYLPADPPFHKRGFLKQRFREQHSKNRRRFSSFRVFQHNQPLVPLDKWCRIRREGRFGILAKQFANACSAGVV
jgi:hypothetical protein